MGCVKQYTREFLIQFLQNKATELGHTPRMYEVVPLSPTPFQREFGSWNDALIEAGFSINMSRQYKEYSKTQIKKMIIDVSHKIGRTPTIKEFNTFKEYPSVETITTKLNMKWNDILRECNLEVNDAYSRNQYSNYTDKQIVQMLKDELDRLNTRNMETYRDNRTNDMPSVTFYKYRLNKTWTEMLKLVDNIDMINNNDILNPNTKSSINYDDLKAINVIDEKIKIKQAVLDWAKHNNGKTPFFKDFENDSSLLKGNYIIRVFQKPWTEIMKSFGLEGNVPGGNKGTRKRFRVKNHMKKQTNDKKTIGYNLDMINLNKEQRETLKIEYINIVIEWVKTNNKVPTMNDFRNDGNLPSINRLLKVYNRTWNQIVRMFELKKYVKKE